MKWRYKDSDKSLTPEQRYTLNFHLGESARIRNAVLAKADLSPPKPPTMAPGIVRTWIHIGQVEIWNWQRWWAIIFWPESMEQSWQQVFADEKFRKTTISKWNKYLHINGIPS